MAKKREGYTKLNGSCLFNGAVKAGEGGEEKDILEVRALDKETEINYILSENREEQKNGLVSGAQGSGAGPLGRNEGGSSIPA